MTVPLESYPPLAELYGPFAQKQAGVVLLETNIPGGWSFLVWSPAVTIRVEEDGLIIEKSKYVELPALSSSSSDLPSVLESILRRFAEPQTGTETSPFTGGLVGYVGYEWQAGQEGPRRATPPGVPGLWFGLFDRWLARAPTGKVQLGVNPSVRGATLGEARRELDSVVPYRTRLSASPTASAGTIAAEDFPRREFESVVRTIRGLIRHGETYQVNLAQRVRVRGSSPEALYARMREINPSPFAGALSTQGFSLVSASPERLFRVDPGPEGSRQVETRPIAGTRPRGKGAVDARNERALRGSPKERAEHTMLVDLSRNDLGRICRSGTVEVNEWFTVERYSHVMHLVSNVRGALQAQAGLPEIFRALMPGGSITGTPKIRATEVIADLEPVPRGAFTGALGYLSLNGRMDFNLLIRSAFFPGGSREAHVYAGAGIVQDSDPAREWKECRAKAAAILEAGRVLPTGGRAWAPPVPSARWSPPRVTRRFPSRKVLVIDNYDSFTYNLVQYLGMLGAEVEVVRNDALTLNALVRKRPTHLVISPGPGGPETAGVSVPAVAAFEGTPILGVCLGLESIAAAYGGTLRLARTILQGKASLVVKTRPTVHPSLLEGLPPKFRAGRYHSLVIDALPECLVRTAEDEKGQVMALGHRTLPTFGVQFHPESMLTEGGLDILSNFLALPPAEP